MLELLLDKGAPLNQRSGTEHGPLPMHWACVQGHVKAVDLFSDRGVDVDATDLNGCSPLIIAAQYGQSLCVSYLLQKGANRFHVDINGDSALHWAAFKGVCSRVVLALIHRPWVFVNRNVCCQWLMKLKFAIFWCFSSVLVITC